MPHASSAGTHAPSRQKGVAPPQPASSMHTGPVLELPLPLPEVSAVVADDDEVVGSIVVDAVELLVPATQSSPPVPTSPQGAAHIGAGGCSTQPSRTPGAHVPSSQ